MKLLFMVTFITFPLAWLVGRMGFVEFAVILCIIGAVSFALGCYLAS